MKGVSESCASRGAFSFPHKHRNTEIHIYTNTQIHILHIQIYLNTQTVDSAVRPNKKVTLSSVDIAGGVWRLTPSLSLTLSLFLTPGSVASLPGRRRRRLRRRPRLRRLSPDRRRAVYRVRVRQQSSLSCEQ